MPERAQFLSDQDREVLKGVAANLNEQFRGSALAWDLASEIRRFPKPIIFDLNEVLLTSGKLPLGVNPKAAGVLEQARQVGSIFIVTDGHVTSYDFILQELGRHGLWADDMVLMTRENYYSGRAQVYPDQHDESAEQAAQEYIAREATKGKVYQSDQFRGDKLRLKHLAPLFMKPYDIPIIDDQYYTVTDNPGMLGLQVYDFTQEAEQREDDLRDGTEPIDDLDTAFEKVVKYYETIMDPQEKETTDVSSQVETLGAKPDFALDKWGYAQADVSRLVGQLSGGNEKVKKELEDALKIGGGKAFGLEICKRFAANFAALPYRIEVPRWDIVRDFGQITHIGDHNRFGLILRSSAEDEDWLDGRSGVFRSFNLDDESDYRAFIDIRKREELLKTPFILQPREEGWGVVVDIGYSPILGKVVVRIASGNTRNAGFPGSRDSFTSATNDTEPSVGVWEAETGYPVLPTVNFGHKSSYRDNEDRENIIVKPLFRALQRTGIDFGVQLELIDDPKNPIRMQLVQLRPTPAKIYKPVLIGSPVVEDGKHGFQRLIARSAIVNGVFDVTGQASLFGTKGIEDNFHLGMGKQPGDISQRKMAGGVGVYDYDKGDNFINLDYSKAGEIYMGGYFAGSDVQLTPVSIRPNTHHGLMDRGNKSGYDLLDQHCGMVSLSKTAIARIKLIANQQGKPPKIRVVSDGLIAEVLFVEDTE